MKTEKSPLITPHELPALGYAYDALEPHIDADTLEVHHDGHHKTYVEKLNKALEGLPEFQAMSIEELMRSLDRVPSRVREEIKNNGGGHFNHSMMWKILEPARKSLPAENLGNALDAAFGSFGEFKKTFSETAEKLFGSGYVWLVVDDASRLSLRTTENQDCPLIFGAEPIFLIDVWEHSYYLKHQNKRPEYVEAYWHVINWAEVSKRFTAATTKAKAA